MECCFSLKPGICSCFSLDTFIVGYDLRYSEMSVFYFVFNQYKVHVLCEFPTEIRVCRHAASILFTDAVLFHTFITL